MTKKEVREFAEKNPIFSLATIEGDQPRVRLMMLAMVNDNGLVFTTGRDKDVSKQLSANPNAEMCFYNADRGLQVRVTGAVELLDDLDLKKQIVEKFPFLQPWVDREGYEAMATYGLKTGKATTWTMDTNFDPKQYIEL